MRLRSRLFIWAAVVLGSACSTAPTIYPEHPLSEQIVKPREGFDGKLTNRAVLEGGVEKMTAYPLEDAAFRDTANRLNFLCNIGGKRYKICKDKPGFCRFSKKSKCSIWPFCKDEVIETEYLPVAQYRFLLDAKTRCANKDVYDLWD